jgi:hypothetical protein
MSAYSKGLKERHTMWQKMVFREEAHHLKGFETQGL